MEGYLDSKKAENHCCRSAVPKLTDSDYHQFKMIQP